MAGLNETSITDSDNFLIKDKNNKKSNFLIAEYHKNHSSTFDTEKSGKVYGYRWYYVNATSGNISNYQVEKYYKNTYIKNILLRTYDQNKTLDSCSEVSIVNKKATCTKTATSDGSLLLGAHVNDSLHIYDMVANHIKPVVIIKLDDYSLSNNTGTSSDPYTLMK